MNDFTLLAQFKNYLENQLNLDEEFVDEKEITFTNYDKIAEESIFVVAIEENKKHYFNTNCYQELENGSALYDFTFYKTELN